MALANPMGHVKAGDLQEIYLAGGANVRVILVVRAYGDAGDVDVVSPKGDNTPIKIKPGDAMTISVNCTGNQEIVIECPPLIVQTKTQAEKRTVCIWQIIGLI